MIKYVIAMNDLGLKIEPMGNSNKTWDIVCFSNSNYAGDTIRRQSISGFILYALGVPVSWQLKLQKSVSHSISEVEYIALLEAVKEVMSVLQLLQSMKRVDNVDAIIMASNITTMYHTTMWTLGTSM